VRFVWQLLLSGARVLSSLAGLVGPILAGLEDATMAQEFQPGQIVPETGTYKVIHVPAHAGALNLVTVIKGRRFPDWQCCQAVTFELVYSFEAYRRDTAGYGRTARERRLSRKKTAVPFAARLKLIPARSGRAIRAWAAGAGIAAAVLTLLAWMSRLK
jgi:hypothetical protein